MRHCSLWQSLVLLLVLPLAVYGQARTADRLQDSSYTSLNTSNPPNGSVRHCTTCRRANGPCQLAGAGETAGSDAIKLGGTWFCSAHSSGAGSGNVIGPGVSVDNELPLFSSTSGSQLKRSNSLSGVVLLIGGVVSALPTTGSGSAVLNTSPSITGLNASTVFSSGTVPPARIISNTLTANKCLRLSSAGAIETAAEDCGAGGGGVPGGVSGNLAYNEAGTFGGVTNSSYDLATGRLVHTQKANGNDTLNLQRFTDTSPTGTLLRARNAANNADLFAISTSGAVSVNSTITFTLTAAPSTPAAGFTTIWADSTGKNLRAQDDAGNVSGTVRAAACSGTDKISAISSAGVITCTPDQGGSGTGVITLNGLNTSDQSFVDVDDTNVTLAISSSVSTHTFTLGWAGTLAKSRQHPNTVYLDQANDYASGAQDFTDADSLTLPTASGAAPTISARIAYDSLNNTLEYGENGTNRIVANTAGAQTLSNKTLDNSITANLRDTLLTLQDNADSTKTVNFEVSAVASGTNRTVSIPNANTVTVQPTTLTTNQFVTHIDSSGVVQKAQPSFANLSGSLSGSQGGTDQTAVSQGDLLVGSGTNTWARLPKSTTAIHYLSNTGASNNPAWAKVDLVNGVTGILLADNGGTANGFFAVSGPATSTKTFTFPNASATVLTDNAAVTIAQGGTGQTTQTAAFNALDPLTTKGDVLVHNGTNSVRLAVGTNGQGLVADSTVTEGVKWATFTAGAGGSTTQLQRNNAGALGGISGATSDGTAVTFTDGALILNGGDYGVSDGSMPASPVEKSFYLNTNSSSRRLFIYNNAAFREIFQNGISGPISVANGGTGLASGTSGGIPYFSGSTTMASSAALTANLPVIGGGAGAAPTVGSRTGNTTTFVTATGALTSGRCAEWDANGNLVQAAAACGTGGGGSPGGLDTQVQFNDGGAFGGDAGLIYNKTTDTLTIAGAVALSASGGGYIELAEGSPPTVVANRLTFVAPADVVSTGLVYVLPADSPTNGEQLTANISGTTVTLSWDAAGSGGSGDSVSVNGSATTDANFISTTASGTVPSITWSLNTGATPDEVSISAIGAASTTEAGVITTGTQSLAGAKLLGHTAALGRLGQTFEITTSANYGGLALSTFSASAFEASLIDFNRSKSATKGTQTVVAADDRLGYMVFRGSDGTDFELAGYIEGAVDGTPGDNDMPGRLAFWTTPDASATPVERWRINSSGHLLAATDNAVDIGASGATRPRTGYFGTSLLSPEFNHSTTVKNLFGAGSPEGAVTAGIGSTYRRTDGGTGTTFYIKESGTGNTGWVAVAAGGGSGTINSGVTNTIPRYTAATTLDDSLLSDDGTNLIYGGSGQGSLGLKDSDASHYQTLQFGSNITADRIFTITTGDAARTLSMSGNITTAADFITSGANSLTLTTTGSTNVTLPTTGTLITADSTKTLTNTTYDPSATGNVFTSIFVVEAPAAGCSGTTASSFWDLPTSTPAVAVCVTGTNTQKAYLDFADTSGGFSAQYNFRLAADFTGTVDAHITWLTSATSGNIEWSLSTICVATDATETDDPAFNTASTVVTAAPGVANRLQTSTITSLTITGCAAGEWIYAKIFRDGNDAQDTLSATARLKGVQFVLRRTQ